MTQKRNSIISILLFWVEVSFFYNAISFLVFLAPVWVMQSLREWLFKKSLFDNDYDRVYKSQTPLLNRNMITKMINEQLWAWLRLGSHGELHLRHRSHGDRVKMTHGVNLQQHQSIIFLFLCSSFLYSSSVSRAASIHRNCKASHSTRVFSTILHLATSSALLAKAM